MYHKLLLIIAILSTVACCAGTPSAKTKAGGKADSAHRVDSVRRENPDSLRYMQLTDDDYRAVADELGINVACIKAVVSIEAGAKAEGFNKDHTPIINFDVSMFRKYARQRGINTTAYHRSHAVVFAAPNTAKYGSYQAAQYARLLSAMTIDTVAALEGTFWGMFQIGGFNWKVCGCESVQQFVFRMAWSEREQLELFAAFITSRNLVRYLRERNWSAFALRYNGPGYKRQRYDERMAVAYRKFSSK